VAETPRLPSRFNGSANFARKGNAQHSTAFGQIAYTVPSKIKRMDTLSVDTSMLLEGESGCCPRKSRIPAPNEVEVFDAFAVQLAS
jgi:hypothetical protein